MMPGGACSRTSRKSSSDTLTPDHGNFLGGRIGHNIGEEPDGVSQCPLGSLKPYHARSYAQEIRVVRKRPHDLFGLFLIAVSFGRCRGSVALTAVIRSRRTSDESSPNARSSW